MTNLRLQAQTANAKAKDLYDWHIALGLEVDYAVVSYPKLYPMYNRLPNHWFMRMIDYK